MNETLSNYNQKESNKKKFIFPFIVLSLGIIGIIYTIGVLSLSPIIEPSSITYDEIISITKKDKDSSTEARWNVQFEPYLGKKVSWTGWVEEVQSNNYNFKVLIDMDSPEVILSIEDVILITEDRKILKLDKGQQVYFEGYIKNIRSTLNKYWIELEKGEIL